MSGLSAIRAISSRARLPVLWLVLAAAGAGVFHFAREAYTLQQENAAIAALNGRSDIVIDTATANGALLLARGNELLRRDRLDEAQMIFSAISSRSSPTYRVKAHYNLANYRVRRASELIAKGDLDGATALVNVAKSEYRLALRLEPENWDLKFNLDVAMRIVRDLPLHEGEAEEAPPDAPVRVWTDLPGVPKGLP